MVCVRVVARTTVMITRTLTMMNGSHVFRKAPKLGNQEEEEEEEIRERRGR